ncbi:MAG: 4-alpha-glucanotransferase, partial [Candidatus Micrarchaeia archaeon]
MPRKKIIQLRAKLESILGDRIDYTRLREVEFEVAKQVYEIFLSKKEKDFEEFCVQNSFWLENYARFMATYRLNGQYPTEIEQIEKAEKENPGVFETYVSLYKYMQYVAYMQLKETIEQIHMEGGRLIFDLPFFRAKNSCEVLFYPEYFDISKRSPYIWGQHWKDLILYNWDKLAEEEYNFLTSPIQHWLRVGFDGVRLDALHFSYPLTHLGHNIVQSGNEKGDDFVSKVVTSIRSVNPRAIIVAEAFEGVDVHLRRMYAIHTIACVDWYSEKDLNNISNNKIWLQISSHDSPRIQDNNTLVEKYGVEYNEESFKTFFNKVLASGAEYVSFTIGDQWGESKRVKEEVNGETLWRYRIPLIAGRTFDITEFIGFITRNAMAKTEDGYFADGYVMGRSIEIEPQKAKDMLERLRTVSLQNFRLLYDYGKKELRDGNINAPHLHSLLVAYRWIKFMGQDGTWSLWHHSSQSDFFTKVYEILEQAGINEKDYPEIYSYLKQLNRKASAATSVLEKANINVQLFGFVQGFLENLLYREYVLTTKQEINPEFRDTFIKLLVAADSFIVKNKDGSLKIFAGYPWFVQSWGRDTFISLPGLLIVTGRYAEAKEVFRYYAKFQREDGLLPNIIHPDGRIEYNTADGSLWFVEALYRYYKATNDRKFIQEMLPVVNKIISLYTTKDRTGEIYMDDDYLVVVPAQWTWMDAAPNKNPVTPRNGKPVEIQALLYNALRISAEFNNMIGDKILAQEFEKIAEEIKMSIRLKYFEDNREYPFDVIDGDPHRDAVRPNALLLLSLSCVDDLLTDEQKQNIIEVVERELLTPFGLRTLSPKDDKYKGYYDTLAPGEIKDQAYHQGTVWPWLMREYILAKINQIRNKPAKEVRQHLITLVHNLCWLISKDCTLPEVFSGDAPHTPGGAVSQA